MSEKFSDKAINAVETANYVTMGLEGGLLAFAIIASNPALATVATSGLILDGTAAVIMRSYKQSGKG